MPENKPPLPRPNLVAQDELAAVVDEPRVSILIPCCGQLECTRLCVPSVLKHSSIPFELIFLDLGSLDGTAAYLDGLAAAATVRVQVVRAPADADIPAACAEAVQRASGEFICLLNNDCIVPAGWLEQLIGLASMTFAMAMVGPMSNYAAPPQHVELIPYRIGPRKGTQGRQREWLVDTSEVDTFAKEFRKRYLGKWFEVERLGGFCLLLKRAVLKKLGPLGEDGLGIFDTDVLSQKARQAGFTLAVCRDLFVHHFGTRTFAHGAPLPEP
jgi:GT2 family glycosyltransferase